MKGEFYKIIAMKLIYNCPSIKGPHLLNSREPQTQTKEKTLAHTATYPKRNPLESQLVELALKTNSKLKMTAAKIHPFNYLQITAAVK